MFSNITLLCLVLETAVSEGCLKFHTHSLALDQYFIRHCTPISFLPESMNGQDLILLAPILHLIRY